MPASGRLLSALRDATRPMHAALDSRISLFDEGLDEARYAKYLRALLEVVAPLEDGIGQVRDIGIVWPDFESRRKAHLLRADIEALHGAAIATSRVAPEVADIPSALGVGYVLEGSTLGGVVLARGIVAKLGAEAPTRYLLCYGEDIGARWRAFVAVLEAAEWQPGEADNVMLQSARATFEAVERSLEDEHLVR